MHPRHDACDVILIVDFFHEFRDAVGRRHDAFEDNGVRELAARVELFDDVFGVAGDVLELLLAIEVLAAGDEPEFIVCVFHDGCAPLDVKSFVRGCVDVFVVGARGGIQRNPRTIP